MKNEVEYKEGRFGLSENGKEMLSRFFSILLTALLSALITFLQSVLVDPSSAPTVHEQLPQAGATGALLRSLVLIWPHHGTMKA